MYLFVDYETRGTVDLPSVGAHEYLDHPDTEILMVGIADGEESPEVWPSLHPVPRLNVPISWGPFDRLVYEKCELGTVTEWVDAQALALYCGLPKSLEGFCRSVGIPAKKDPRGTRLINLFCKPDENGRFREMTAEDRKAMEEYCLQDVRLLRDAWKVLEPLYAEWKQTQGRNYEVVRQMNDRGVPIDRVAAQEALIQIKAQEVNLSFEFTDITGLKATQTAEVTKWFGTPDVRRETLLATEFTDPKKQRAKEIRLSLSNASVKKLVPMLEASELTGRVRGAFVSNGAHTGRCTSHLVQFQNFKRSKVDETYFSALHKGFQTSDPLLDAQSNLRGFIAAPPDKVFAVADYAQVEVRVLAWMSGDEELLRFFTEGTDPYRQFAGLIFDKKPEDITDHERQLGKIDILGSGYGCSGPGLARQAVGYGVQLSETQAWKLVKKYRETFKAVPEMWHTFESGLKWLMKGTIESFEAGRCEFSLSRSKKILVVTLPSGRKLRYMYPKLEGEYVTYTTRLGVNTTRKKIWGGHMTENLCQAIAADLKFDAMARVSDSLIAEVHDEIVLECPSIVGETRLAELIEVMETPPDWFDVKGLIKSEGKLMRRYSK